MSTLFLFNTTYSPQPYLMHLIDTHVHLDFPDFDPDRSSVIQRAKQAGVQEMISIGTNQHTSRAAFELATHYPEISATVGIHPCEVATASLEDEALLRHWAAQPCVVALGEIGLDYHRLPSQQFPQPDAETSSVALERKPMSDAIYQTRQKEIFRQQLDLACELGLNAVIHQRDAWEDTLAILRDYKDRLRCVFHCFSGTPEQAQFLIQQGYLISFTGIVTFKNACQVQAAAQALPLDKIMVETDCPYLAPTPHRGQRCEPAYTRLIAEKIAELHRVPLEKVAETTTQTARDFFRFA